MTRKEELILKASKEIMVKFIETGRIFPNSFEEHFNNINRVVRDSIQDDGQGSE